MEPVFQSVGNYCAALSGCDGSTTLNKNTLKLNLNRIIDCDSFFSPSKLKTKTYSPAFLQLTSRYCVVLFDLKLRFKPQVKHENEIRKKKYISSPISSQ